MKWLIPFFLMSSLAMAETSKVIPAFLEAASVYVNPDYRKEMGLFVKPEIRAIVEILEKKKIEPEFLTSLLNRKAMTSLPADDKYDAWIKKAATNVNPQNINEDVPPMAFHAIGIDVIEESDDFFNDNIYAYFFITDGVIPTGKVTSIYKGVDEGQGFFFNEVDRAIFPLLGVNAKVPQSHLIIDYGIIESDGDDVAALQKLSSVIIDIAIAVYSTVNPQGAEVIVKLRKEIKALADLLLSLNHDDRLVTASFGFKTKELADMLRETSYVQLTKNHKKDTRSDSWEYNIHFRLLRN